MLAYHAEIPMIRIRFPVLGDQVPVDHHEALYAALSRIDPEFHQLTGLSISSIIGGESMGEQLRITNKSSLYFQIPYDHLKNLVRLAGRKLRIANNWIRLGVPQMLPLYPSPRLYSRFVTIKNAVTEEEMKVKVHEQLLNMDITLSEQNIQVLRRRIITIHQRKIVGFGLLLKGIDDESSLKIQLLGIGGRRRYASGFFLPMRSDAWDE